MATTDEKPKEIKFSPVLDAAVKQVRSFADAIRLRYVIAWKFRENSCFLTETREVPFAASITSRIAEVSMPTFSIDWKKKIPLIDL